MISEFVFDRETCDFLAKSGLGTSTAFDEKSFYHLRIHYGSINVEDIISFIKDKSTPVIIVRETHSARPHIHCVIQPKKTVSTFRQQMLVKFPTVKGNGVYSLETVKYFGGVIRYCCKGDNEVSLPDVLYTVYTNELIKYFHLCYHKLLLGDGEAASSDRSEVNSDVKPKSKKAVSWTEKVFKELIEYEVEVRTIQQYHNLYNPTESEEKKYKDSKLVLFTHMLRCYGNTAKQIDDFILQRHFKGFLNGILARSEKEVFDKYAQKMFLKLDL